MHRSTALALTALVLFLMSLSSMAAGDRPPTKPKTPTLIPTATPPATPRYPWQTNEDRIVLQRLQVRLLDAHFDDVPLESVLDTLRSASGLNIVASWGALEAMAIEKDAELSLNVRAVRISEVLDLVLEQAGAGEIELAWGVWDGIVHVSTKEDLSRVTTRVMYDCTDLLRVEESHLGRHLKRVFEELRKQTGRELSGDVVAAERLVRVAVSESRRELTAELINAIQDTVDPESWRESGGNVGSIAWVHTTLVVTQTCTAQAGVFDFLTELRANRPKLPPAARWP